MADENTKKGICSVCGQRVTPVHAEAAPDLDVYVCERCLEAAKDNFIWICMNCGRTYMRPKATVLRRLTDPHLKDAYDRCAGIQIIQGIDMCIQCDPEGIVEFVAARRERCAGTC